MKRSQFVWNVLVVLAVLVILVSGYRLYSIRGDVNRYNRTSNNEQFGTDQELDSLITYLEGNLQRRELFTFNIRNKPVLLSNVIFLNEELATAHRRDVIRVSAIIGATANIAPAENQGATQAPFVRTEVNNLNMRAENSTGSPVVTRLRRGTRLQVVDEDNGWYHVRTKSHEGWVAQDFVSEKYIARVSGSQSFGNDDAVALVQYRGKNYRLSVGDTLAGGRVLALQPSEMVMQMNNRKVTIPVLGLSMTPEEAEKYRVD